jgi:hypothetical protein
MTHSTVSVSSKTVMRQYNEDYTSFGFISPGEKQPRPNEFCGEKMANRAMVPSKLKRHLHTKHSHLCEEPIKYFKRFIADQTCRLNNGRNSQSFSDKAQKASYAVAEIVAK